MTPQSNGNDVGNGNDNEVVSNKEGDGKGCKSNGDGNKGGVQATKRATAMAGRAISTAMKMTGDKEGNDKGGKRDGSSNKGGRQGQQQWQWPW